MPCTDRRRSHPPRRTRYKYPNFDFSSVPDTFPSGVQISRGRLEPIANRADYWQCPEASALARGEREELLFPLLLCAAHCVRLAGLDITELVQSLCDKARVEMGLGRDAPDRAKAEGGTGEFGQHLADVVRRLVLVPLMLTPIFV